MVIQQAHDVFLHQSESRHQVTVYVKVALLMAVRILLLSERLKQLCNDRCHDVMPFIEIRGVNDIYRLKLCRAQLRIGGEVLQPVARQQPRHRRHAGSLARATLTYKREHIVGGINIPLRSILPVLHIPVHHRENLPVLVAEYGRVHKCLIGNILHDRLVHHPRADVYHPPVGHSVIGCHNL